MHQGYLQSLDGLLLKRMSRRGGILTLLFIVLVNCTSGAKNIGDYEKELKRYFQYLENNQPGLTIEPLVKLNQIFREQYILDIGGYENVKAWERLSTPYLTFARELPVSIESDLLPMFIYLAVKKHQISGEEGMDRLLGLKAKEANYASKLERYLLLVSTLQVNLSDEARLLVVTEALSSLEASFLKKQYCYGFGNCYETSWLKYLIAQGYYQKASLLQDPNHKLQALQMAKNHFLKDKELKYEYAVASDYQLFQSVDQLELEVMGELIKLVDQDTYLEHLADVAYNNPSEKHLVTLQKHFQKSGNLGSFQAFWHAKIEERASEFPNIELAKLSGKLFDLDKWEGKWGILDFWGTWCVPCLGELPALNRLQVRLEQDPQLAKQFAIHTLACSDKEVKVNLFMKKKGYKFDVSITPMSLIKAIGIKEYPTKYLITPGGKAIKIEYASDWQFYIKQYTGLPF